MTTSKPCVVCGVDCTGRPRVKDPKGRYYCKPCYDSHVAEAPIFVVPEASLGTPRRETPAQPLIPRVTRALIAPASPAAMKAMGFVAAMATAFGSTPDRLMTRNPQTLQALNWSHVLLLGAFGGVIGGLLYWWLGGRWFHARLRWSGVNTLDISQTRAVYFATVLPPGLWAACFTLALPIWFATPRNYVEDFHPIPDAVMPIGLLLLLILGCVAIFLMAWRGLGAKLVPSVCWFLVLPLIVYAAQVAAMVAIIMLGHAGQPNAPLANVPGMRSLPPAGEASPAIDSPQTFAPTAAAPFAFEYPGNWSVEVDGPAEGNRYATVFASGPDGSVVSIDLLEGESLNVPPEGVVDGIVEAMGGEEGTNVVESLPHHSAGKFRGTGRRIIAKQQGARLAIKVLVVDLGNERLLLITQSPVPDPVYGHRGVDMVLESLEVAAGQ